MTTKVGTKTYKFHERKELLTWNKSISENIWSAYIEANNVNLVRSGCSTLSVFLIYPKPAWLVSVQTNVAPLYKGSNKEVACKT